MDTRIIAILTFGIIALGVFWAGMGEYPRATFCLLIPFAIDRLGDCLSVLRRPARRSFNFVERTTIRRDLFPTNKR